MVEKTMAVSGNYGCHRHLLISKQQQERESEKRYAEIVSELVRKCTLYRMHSCKHEPPCRASEVLVPSLYHSTPPHQTTDLGALGVVWQSKHYPHEGRSYPQFLENIVKCSLLPGDFKIAKIYKSITRSFSFSEYLNNLSLRIFS